VRWCETPSPKAWPLVKVGLVVVICLLAKARHDISAE
jgi:hypothetical protein